MLPGHRIAPKQQHFVAAVAAPLVSDDASGAVLDVDGIIDLTHRSSTRPSRGSRRRSRLATVRVLVARHRPDRLALGSVNYTVSYVDRDGADAVIDYWRDTVLTPELREQIARNPRAQMYMDSLELTPGAPAACSGDTRWRRSSAGAAAMTSALAAVPGAGDPDDGRRHDVPVRADDEHATTSQKVRHDYVQTLTDLYIENMLRPFADFLHENGMLLRSEISYGLPFELTRPGPEVDGIETESLEFGSQIDAYRLLAGPAHLFGKQYSSETGATTRNHMLDHRFYDQIIATQLAAGVTKTVLHGWASTAGAEDTTQWPGHEGMWSMFSERFDLRQPASEFYPLWNKAIGRFQYLLRQGRPRIDVGILRTDHFVDNLSGMVFRR